MYAFRLPGDIQADLARLAGLRRRLDARGVLPRRWIGRLRRDLEADAVAASTSMEGVPVTGQEVRRILAGDRPPSVSEGDAALVAGYREAMSFVLRRADSTGFDWHRELIISIHDRVMGGDFSLGAGDYRRNHVFVGSASRGSVYAPPAPELVPGLVDELARWLSQADDVPPPVRAALAHIGLAGIHPFSDGNGRTARILASLAMYRGGFRLPEFTSLEEWWGRHLDDYYSAFECLGEGWRPDVDVTPFVRAHVRAQVAQVESLSLRHSTEGAVWVALEDVVTEDLPGPPRMTDALYDAFFGRRVTNRYYRGLADVSAATAASDLKRLQSAGLLAAEGAGRNTSYVGTARLMAVVGAAAGIDLPQAGASVESMGEVLIAGLAARMRAADADTYT
ncbi:MAG: Fic family protein [Anaerolineae bacterium]